MVSENPEAPPEGYSGIEGRSEADAEGGPGRERRNGGFLFGDRDGYRSISGEKLVIIKANAMHIPMKDESVHCIVTSPPYWGLRRYQIPDSIWDGDPECEHEWEEVILTAANGIIHDGGMSGETLSGESATRKPKRSNFCIKCGGWHGQLGLEPRMGMYINHIVQIFQEIRRVLRRDGTAWLVIGDSYAGSMKGMGTGGKAYGGPKQQTNIGSIGIGRPDWSQCVLKPKDLCMIPARVAIALQEDGWWIRSDIIWAKPNPMPESVEDRPTRSHEYIFLLKNSASYFWDQEAVKESSITNDPRRPYGSQGGWSMDGRPEDQRHGGEIRISCQRKELRSNIESRHRSSIQGGQSMQAEPNGTRNIRSVWTIAISPYAGAHFAVFPGELVKRCIKAGTSEKGCCPKCGAPWERIVNKERLKEAAPSGNSEIGRWSRKDHGALGGRMTEPKTTGWQPTCSCGEPETVPCVVLDPFAGSGTTLKVAESLGRIAIGLDLGYHELAKVKTSNNQMILTI